MKKFLPFLKSDTGNIYKRPNLFFSVTVSIILCIIVPAVTILTTEWIARGTLGSDGKTLVFLDAVKSNGPSFAITYLLLFFSYICIAFLTKTHVAAILLVGLFGNLIGAATYFKLSMRNEPLLPWDLYQIAEFTAIIDEVDLSIQANMIITLIIFAVLIAVGHIAKVPRLTSKKADTVATFSLSGGSLVAVACLMFFVFLNPVVTLSIGIEPDMWMQDRYYRYNGVISGFLTNLPLLDIEKPTGYSSESVDEILQEVEQNNSLGSYDLQPSGSFSEDVPPDIIYVMAEGFWDMEELPGISYDRELMSNFNRLAEEAASGWAYSPSYGGGTCDVEFEALTGFSMEYLPAGSKPYQQYINSDVYSLPWLLKDNGYETLAIHGYGERFWNRDVVYPRLGIDTFIAEEQMQGAERRRGFISDQAMVDRIIQEQQNRSTDDNPLFIHAVTMQNHTTYYPTAYPAEDMVQITENSAGLSQEILGELSDCATGIYEMDQALGYLTDYLLTIDRPTIVVFWGDHLNPMSNGYGVFEDTGFIQQDDTTHPNLYKLPLLIWSNTENVKTDLGVLSTYNISPVMMGLFDMEMPIYYDFLIQQLAEYTASSKGVMHYPDASYTREKTEEQEQLLYDHSILQYDLLFGNKYTIQQTNP